MILNGGEVVSLHLVLLCLVWPKLKGMLVDPENCYCEETVLIFPWVEKRTADSLLMLLYTGFCDPMTENDIVLLKEFLKEVDICISLTEAVVPNKDDESFEAFIRPCYEDDEEDDEKAFFVNKVAPTLFLKKTQECENMRKNEIRICNSSCPSQCDQVARSWSEEEVSELRVAFKEAKDVDTKNNLINHLKSQERLGLATDMYQIKGLKLCIKYFAHSTGISLHIVKTVLHDFWKGQRMYEHGNKGIMKQQISTTQFIVWMKEFSEWYGQYSPDREKIILNYWLRKGVLYQMYCEESSGPHIGQSTFYKYFEDYFGPNRKDKSLPCVRISKYSSHSICNTCIALNNNRRQCKSEAELGVAKDLINQHKQIFGGAFRRIQEIKQSALSHPTDHLFVQIDGMDNAKSYLPRYLQKAKETEGTERIPTKISGCIIWSGLYEEKRKILYYLNHDQVS